MGSCSETGRHRARFTPGSVLDAFSLQPSATLRRPCSLPQDADPPGLPGPPPSCGFGPGKPSRRWEEIEAGVFMSLRLPPSRSPSLAIPSTPVPRTASPAPRLCVARAPLGPTSGYCTGLPGALILGTGAAIYRGFSAQSFYLCDGA